MKTMSLIPMAAAVIAAVLIPSCTTPPHTVVERQDQTISSIDQTKSGYDTFGRKWVKTPEATTPETTTAVVASTPSSSALSCTAAINTGLIHLAKRVPEVVQTGREFMYELDGSAVDCAANVVITDTVPPGATYVRSDPAATVDGNKLIWNIGDVDSGANFVIKVWLHADQEGTLVSCATVKADPRVCAVTRVVKASIELTESEPADVTVCDPIPVVLTVKNTGSSQLTGVHVTDTLPSGLASDGKNSVSFDAGSLAPGESKEFKYTAQASAPGKYDHNAEVTTEQDVTAKAMASTTVHQSVLSLSCKAPDQQYIGRNVDVCLSLSDTADIPASAVHVTLPIPSGLTVKSVSNGGRADGGNVVWDVDTLAANSPANLCVTFVGEAAGTFTFNASAKATCAAEVTTSCQSKVVGIAGILLEKADDPDPIAVGETTTYTVKVTNQGSADDHNVQVVVTIPAELSPVSTSEGTIEGQTVTCPMVPVLPAKQTVTYKIVAKGVKAGDGHTNFRLSADVLSSPINAEESTTVY